MVAMSYMLSGSGDEMHGAVQGQHYKQPAFVFIFILLPSPVSAEECPISATGGDMRIYNHTCYLFVNDEVYWKTARKSCWSKGGEMLIIADMG